MLGVYLKAGLVHNPASRLGLHTVLLQRRRARTCDGRAPAEPPIRTPLLAAAGMARLPSMRKLRDALAREAVTKLGEYQEDARRAHRCAPITLRHTRSWPWGSLLRPVLHYCDTPPSMSIHIDLSTCLAR